MIFSNKNDYSKINPFLYKYDYSYRTLAFFASYFAQRFDYMQEDKKQLW